MAYAEAPMGKHQASSIKFQKSSKIQAPKGHLEFGIWNFFGAWNLKFSAFCVFTLFGLSSLPPRTFAASNSLLYQYGEQVFMIDPKNEWREEGEVPVYNGREITLDPGTPFPSTVTVIKKIVWNEEKIAGALEESIGVLLNRDPGSVRIGGRCFDHSTPRDRNSTNGHRRRSGAQSARHHGTCDSGRIRLRRISEESEAQYWSGSDTVQRPHHSEGCRVFVWGCPWPCEWKYRLSAGAHDPR